MKKAWTIIRKEWLEVFQNRLVIFTVVFLPLLMTAIPLAVLYGIQGTNSATGNVTAELPAEMTQICQSGMSSGDCMKVFLINEFMILFMIIPVAIPGAIAGYSVVGEKTTHSLEPLLATPITTVELLVGKCLAAVLPAVLATYAGFGVFLAGARIILGNSPVFSAMLDARWLLAIFLVGPLLAILAVTFALMVSSRVNDPRVAEQISMVIIIPVLAGFFGQLSGLFILNKEIISITALVMVLLDALMFYLATQIFQRESILTRWR